VSGPVIALNGTERRLFGVYVDGDRLRCRPTGWIQLGAGAQMAVAAAFLLLLRKLGTGRSLLVGVAAALAIGAWGLLMWLGTVYASRDGLRIIWFGVRRIHWDQVDGFTVSSCAPIWAPGFPPFEVVCVRLRDGRSVTLWPTRSAAVAIGDAPSAAAAQCGLLERYRATLSV
jgi:hypothetical protein